MSGFDATTVAQWLGTYAIHSTVLIGLVWITCRVLPQLGYGTRDMLWKLGLVGGLVSTSVQVGAHVRPLAPTVELSGPGAPVGATADIPDAPLPVHEIHRVGPVDVELAALGPVPAPIPAAPLLSEPAPSASTGPDPVLLTVGLWLLLASGLLVRLARAYGRLHRGLARRRSVDDSRVLEAFARVRAKAGIDRPILLSVSDEIGSPVALATGEICVGARVMAELSTEQLESVLAHELAHVRRHDPVWLGVAAVIEAVFFFQPLNRVARRGMQESAEYLCDDRAVAWTGSGLALARSLAEVAGWRGQAATSPLVAAMVRREGPLVRRVGRLLDEDRALEREPGHGRTAAVALFGVAGLVAVAPGLVSAAGPDDDDALTVVVVGEGDDPHVLHIDPSELEHELVLDLEHVEDLEDLEHLETLEGLAALEHLGSLAALHDPDDDDDRGSKRKRARRKRAGKSRRDKARRGRRGRGHDDDGPRIVIVPRVHMPEVRTPHVVIPQMQLPQMQIVMPPMPPMPPQEHPEEWEKWERELELEMKKLEKKLEGHAHEWRRDHERARREHERERAARDRAMAERHRERAQRDRELAERQRERAKREHGGAHGTVEQRLLEEARRAQREAERQQRRAEQLRQKAEQLRERRHAGDDVERL